MSKIKCTMTVVATYDPADTREALGETDDFSDQQVMNGDEESLNTNELSIWDLDADAQVSYQWELIP